MPRGEPHDTSASEWVVKEGAQDGAKTSHIKPLTIHSFGCQPTSSWASTRDWSSLRFIVVMGLFNRKEKTRAANSVSAELAAVSSHCPEINLQRHIFDKRSPQVLPHDERPWYRVPHLLRLNLVLLVPLVSAGAVGYDGTFYVLSCP